MEWLCTQEQDGDLSVELELIAMSAKPYTVYLFKADGKLRCTAKFATFIPVSPSLVPLIRKGTVHVRRGDVAGLTTSA